MLKVNEEKLLHDLEELVDKREANFSEIEAQARKYAVARGYDEERTEKFVAYTCELEGDGLSAEDRVKLATLETYVEEVDDPVTDEVVVDADVEEAETAPDAVATATITNI